MSNRRGDFPDVHRSSFVGFPQGHREGTSITNYQKNGVVISGAGATVTAQSNTVTVYGMISYIAQNGIEVASGASALVKGTDQADKANRSAGPVFRNDP
jgi:hypothetical protein